MKFVVLEMMVLINKPLMMLLMSFFFQPYLVKQRRSINQSTIQTPLVLSIISQEFSQRQSQMIALVNVSFCPSPCMVWKLSSNATQNWGLTWPVARWQTFATSKKYSSEKPKNCPRRALQFHLGIFFPSQSLRSRTYAGHPQMWEQQRSLWPEQYPIRILAIDCKATMHDKQQTATEPSHQPHGCSSEDKCDGSLMYVPCTLWSELIAQHDNFGKDLLLVFWIALRLEFSCQK